MCCGGMEKETEKEKERRKVRLVSFGSSLIIHEPPSHEVT